MIDKYTKQQFLTKYLTLIFSGRSDVIRKREYYNFRCEICGDSKKNKTKKRGFILTNKDNWTYYCQNCGVSISVESFIKQYYPLHYKQYIMELLKEKAPKKTVINESEVFSKEKKKKTESLLRERKISSSFVKIKQGSGVLFEKAVKYCQDRRIPENVWEKWYVAEKGAYAGRLIIPFYNDKGKIYYYQARTLVGSEPKYTSMVGEKRFYNIYNVDKMKPVVVCEGPIDSLFLPNSVAIIGSSLSIENFALIKSLGNVYWLFDFDKTGLEKAKKYLNKGETVFLWEKFASEKFLPIREKFDINDAILYLNRTKFEFEELKPYFSNSIFDKIWL